MRRVFTSLFLSMAAASHPALATLHFEQNAGQAPPGVRLLARGPGYSIHLKDSEALIALASGRRRQTLRLIFEGGRASGVRGDGDRAALSHYLMGSDPARWRRNISNFSRARYRSLYPGIDLVFYGNRDKHLEFDFEVSPGADPSAIRLKLEGADSRLLPDGDVAWGELTLRAPVVYQDSGGQRLPVAGRYARSGAGRYRFLLGGWDRTRKLIIDPVLEYGTYLGGVGGSAAESLAADAQGNIYLTGTVTSNEFPTENPMDPFFRGSNDVFVSKFDPTGTRLIYSTFIGSWGDDRALAIAVDSAGSAYVTGYTVSTDFPITSGAFQLVHSGGRMANGGDAFVSKLSPEGAALVYSTFLGGSADEFARSIAVDAAGNAYIFGSTTSENFPLLFPIRDSLNGGQDAFLTKLAPDGSRILFSSFIGGDRVEEGNSLALGPDGSVYIAGTTNSSNFPTTENARQIRFAGGTRDAFIARIDIDKSSFLYATLHGGTGDDFARAIAVDAVGFAYVTGYTTSTTSFPTRNPWQAARGGGRDIFVLQLAPDLSRLGYSTFLGGSTNDEGFGITVDRNGNAYVAGFTTSIDYPLVNPVQNQIGGVCLRTPCVADVAIAKLDLEGSIVYSTYLGGSGADQARAVVIDPRDGVCVTGNTPSVDFPVPRGFQEVYPGGGRPVAFLVRLQP